MTTRHPIPEALSTADAFALGRAFLILHAAITLVPGDPKAKETARLFHSVGLYRKNASSFTAREGGRALSRRAERVMTFVRAEHDRIERRRKPARRRKRKATR